MKALLLYKTCGILLNKSLFREEVNDMPIWNKVQITDQAIARVCEHMNDISEEEAFDLLLDLIENAEHAKFKGIDSVGADIFRLENEYLYIKNNSLVDYSKRSGYARKTVAVIHELEDGRCERCGRGMDKKAASLLRINTNIFHDLNNYTLLCPDCMLGQPDKLLTAEYTESTILKYQEVRNISLPEALDELKKIKNNLVLLIGRNNRRLYWFNNLGLFSLVNDSIHLIHIYKNINPDFKKREQLRSRRWN